MKTSLGAALIAALMLIGCAQSLIQFPTDGGPSCTSGITCSTNPGAPCLRGKTSCVSGATICVDDVPVDAGVSCGTGKVCNGTGSCVGCEANQACSSNAGAPCVLGKISCASGAPECVNGDNAPAGTMCSLGVCTGSGQCGPCSAGTACIPDGGTVCQRGALSCASGSPVCSNVVTFDAGTNCGVDQVCDPSGACVGCVHNASCASNPTVCKVGITSCATGVQQCLDSTQARDAGTPCGTNQVCSPTATCVSCTENASCSGNPTFCKVGVNTCGSGAPSCVDSAQQLDAGTSCGQDQVCSPAAVCVACVENEACSSNPTACKQGLRACSTGVPTCIDDAANRAPGTSCGTNLVCSPTGTCIACTSGAACSPNGNVCRTGAFGCSTGAAVCAETGNAAEGTSCTGGKCFNGACVPDVTITTSVNLSTTPVTPGRTCPDMISAAVTGFPTASSTVVSVAPDAGCFGAGDTVVIINLQGAPGATTNTGNYEYLKVASVAGATVTFETPKTKFYGASASADDNIGTGPGQQRVMLERVAVFSTLTISSAATVTGNGWNGQTNGVLAIQAATFTLDGTLTMSGKGFRGGVSTDAGAPAEAEAGWLTGLIDRDGADGSGNNGGNGGGAPTTGAGNGAAGKNGTGGTGFIGGGGAGDGWFEVTEIPSRGGGGGAAAYTHARLNLSPGMVGRAFMGPGGTAGGGGGGGGGYLGLGGSATPGLGGRSNGRGGAPGASWSPSPASAGLNGGAGGNGGGIVLLNATTLTVSGTGAIVVDGATGGAGGTGGQGGGGVDGAGGGGSGGQGAAGGTIIAVATTRTAPTGFAKARGGNGGKGGDSNRLALGLNGAGGTGGVFTTGGEAGGNGANGTNSQMNCGNPCFLVNGGGAKGGSAGTPGSVLLVP